MQLREGLVFFVKLEDRRESFQRFNVGGAGRDGILQEPSRLVAPAAIAPAHPSATHKQIGLEAPMLKSRAGTENLRGSARISEPLAKVGQPLGHPWLLRHTLVEIGQVSLRALEAIAFVGEEFGCVQGKVRALLRELGNLCELHQAIRCLDRLTLGFQHFGMETKQRHCPRCESECLLCEARGCL
jgi:hypothetical protein